MILDMPADLQAVADEVFATIGTGRQVSPLTSRPDGLTLDDAYRVSAGGCRNISEDQAYALRGEACDQARGASSHVALHLSRQTSTSDQDANGNLDSENAGNDYDDEQCSHVFASRELLLSTVAGRVQSSSQSDYLSGAAASARACTLLPSTRSTGGLRIT
jgi:hypothetical protein